MKSAVDETKDTVTIRAKHRDEEGKTKVEKVELHTHNVDTIKHVERKLIDTGAHRLDRHSVVGKGTSVKKPPPKKGHGGKYTWEGPNPDADNELDAVQVLDKGDPNYEEEEVGNEEGVGDVVRGEVQVAKVVEGREGVARIDVDPKLNV